MESDAHSKLVVVSEAVVDSNIRLTSQPKKNVVAMTPNAISTNWLKTTACVCLEKQDF